MIKLTKIPKSLEQEYDKHLASEKIHLTRLNSILGIVLIAISAAIESWVLPSALYQALLIKGLVVLTLFFVLISSYHPSYLKYYTKVIPIAILTPGFAICFLIYLSTPSDPAYYVYFAGLPVVLMFLYSWAHLKITNLLVITFILVGSYILAVLANKGQDPFGDFAILIPSLFILFAGITVGLLGKIIRDNYLQENFLLQQSLKASFEKKEKEADAHEYQANHDQLTGLLNRHFANEYLPAHFESIKQLSLPMDLMYLDLNGLKEINDTFGHYAGDAVLQVVANRLQLCTGKKDLVMRLGGDEFAICLVPELGLKTNITEISEKIEKNINLPIKFQGTRLTISTSIGVASYPKDGDNIDSLISIADKEMYKHKSRLKKMKKSLSNK